MSKTTPKLPTSEDLKYDATARAEVAEKRVRDMETAKKELLAGATLVAGFGDGVCVVTGILRAAAAVDCPTPAQAAIAELADVLDANRQKLMDEYSTNAAPKRVGTIRIEPV